MLRFGDDDMAIDYAAASAAIGAALAEIGTGDAHQLGKRTLPAPAGGMFLSMAATVPGLGIAVAKWASYVPGAAGAVSTSSILVSDLVSGAPVALIEGMRATTLRTACAVASIVQAADRAPVRVALIGYGQVNRAVAEVLATLFPSIEAFEVAVSGEPAARATVGSAAVVPARSVASAVAGADLVVSATGTRSPLSSVSAAPSSSLVIALDGAIAWDVDVDSAAVLSDHDADVSSLSLALAGRGEATVADARFVDFAGSAVADAAVAAILLGGER